MKKTILFFFLLFFSLSVFAANESWWDVFWQVGDKSAPTTSTDYNGDCVTDGAIILTLTCIDTGGAGCNTIYARVAGEPWSYSVVNPWTFSLWRDENVILEYYSVDNAGNVELVKAQQICFITTPKKTERYIADYDLRVADLTRYYLQGDTRTTDANRYYRPTDRRGHTVNQGNMLPSDDFNFPLFYIFIGVIIIGFIVWYKW